MSKTIIVLTNWEGEKPFKEKKKQIESVFGQDFNFKFLIRAEDKRDQEVIRVTDKVQSFTKKDFSFFGKVKNRSLKSFLENTEEILLVDDISPKLLALVLKNTTLLSVGKADDNNPTKFNISIQGEQIKGVTLYEKTKELLNKIK